MKKQTTRPLSILLTLLMIFGSIPVFSTVSSAANYSRGSSTVGTNGNVYVLYKDSITGPTAKLRCTELGGHLATVTSSAEETMLKNLMTENGCDTAFIGFDDTVTEGSFKWVTGEAVSYTNWNSGEPNNSGDEDYTTMSKSGGWNDIGTSKSYWFICEFEASAFTPYSTWSMNGRRYELYTNKLSAPDAMAFAESKGGKLITVNSAAENNKYKAMLSAAGISTALLGINDAASEDKFVWHSGEYAYYTNWASGEPNDSGGEDYADIAVSAGTWNDIGNQNVFPFAVEYAESRSPAATTVYNGHIYSLFNYPLSTAAAKSFCESRGGYLATIGSAGENDAVKGLINSVGFGASLIGFSDVLVEGQFRWLNGEPVTYTNWSSGEPSNSSNEDYTVMFSDGKWNDIIAAQIGSFVMEMSFEETATDFSLKSGYFGSSYYQVFTDSFNAVTAQSYCATLGGHLVTITSADENNFVKGLMSTNGISESLIGFNDAASEGNFVWVTGEATSYTNWNSGEPNDSSSNEDYACIQSSGGWNDISSSTNKPFIMEIDNVYVNKPVYYNGSYYLLCEETVNFASAKAACEAMGGHLVTISSAAENDFVKTLLLSHGDTTAHIGFTDEATEGSFKWVNGESVTYTNWNSGEPNDSSGEDYTSIQSNGGWNDINASTSYFFICEWERDNYGKAAQTYYNGHLYTLYEDDFTYAEAAQACKEMGGHLVTITDSAENGIVAGLVASAGSNGAYIGIDDSRMEGTFKWTTGEAVSYSNWSANEPNNYGGNEDCGIILKTGLWNDVAGVSTSDKFGFICETEPESFDHVAQVYYNGSMYRVYDRQLYWTEAKVYSELHGGHLVTITSAAEQSTVASLVQKATGNNEYSIGLTVPNTSLDDHLSASPSSGAFTWVTGESVAYTNWNTSEPNSSGNNEFWTSIIRSSGKWNDVSNFASNHKMGFVTEFDNYPTVTVTFKYPDGTVIGTQTVPKTMQVTKPADPARTGYIFGGWFMDSACTAEWNFTSDTVAINTDIYAKWTPISYTIAFDSNGGTGTTAPLSATYDTAKALTNNGFTRTGYTFSGWCLDAAGTGTVYANMQSVKNLTTVNGATVKLYAKWTANSYTVVFNANTGSGTMDAQGYTYDAAAALSANTFTKTGYSFANWNTAANGSGDSYTDMHSVSNLAASGTVNLYAQWKINQYTITFDSNGGSAVAPITQNYATTVTAPANPTKTGYTFTGWSAAVPSTMPAENMTLTAKWSINSYKVKYYIDGELAYEDSFDYGTAVTARPNATKTGYTFSGWSAIPENMPAEDVTVNGSFTINSYKVQYYIDGELAYEDSFDYGTAVTARPNATKTGYSFCGWSAIPSTMPAENVTVNGSFTINSYKVRYYIDGELAYEDSFDYDTAVTARPNATKTGYTFGGWSAIPENMPAGDVTVNGSFTINSYKVQYYIDGEFAYEDSFNYDTAVTARPNATKTGYTFGGWSAIPENMPAENVRIDGSFNINSYKVQYYIDGEFAYEDSFDYDTAVTARPNATKTGYTFGGWSAIPSTMPAGDVRIDGSFTINSYTITFNTNGGTEIAAITQNYATTVVAPASPEKTGYTFAGWSREIPATMPAGDITITANWTVNSYKVKYYIDNEFAYEDSFDYAADITARADAAKTGYTFSGWSEIPATMPAEDIRVDGTFAINSYKVKYYIDDEFAYEDSFDYAADITVREYAAKTGYTFSGWSEIPATMPAEDIRIDGTFAINSYKVKYYIDDEFAYEDSFDYAADVTARADAAKTGYTFSGWSEIPATMPAEDIRIDGSFTINSYRVKYYIDDEFAYEDSFDYAADITARADAAKTGYTFSGWSELPATMPAEDIRIDGTFAINSYRVKYYIDDEFAYEDSFDYAADVTARVDAAKTGYTFSGWSELPATMPAEDIRIDGTFAINSYTIAFDTAGGTEIKAITQNYASSVTAPENPTKTGYTFTGWSAEVPATMPAENITLTAQWSVNSYKVKYYIDGEFAYEDSFDFDSAVTAREPATKTGYTFSGWSELPATMPAEEVTVNGTFTINSYKVKYYLDGELAYEDSFDYAAAVTARPDAAKTGYSFGGWSEIPAVMPANDVTVNGAFTINSYKVSYYIDGEFAYEDSFDYATAVTARADAAKTGYTFSGWSELPAVMPAGDIRIDGSFTINSYKVQYYIDGELTYEDSFDYGTAVTARPNATKTGYSFGGWSEIPAVMPANDVTVNGAFTVNSYKVSYYINGEFAYEDSFDYATAVTARADAAKTGYTFSGWSELPAVMPAEDIRIDGSFTINSYKVKYYLDGEFAYEDSFDYATAVTARPDAEKTGYSFGGWSEIPAVMPAGDVRIDGSFTINSYTITFNADGGTETASITQDYATEIVPPADPTRTGYAFAGWSTAVPTEMPDGNITLTAQWTPNTYTIAFDANSGSGSMESVVTAYDKPEQLAENSFIKRGYDFIEWNTKPDGSGAKYGNGTTVTSLTDVNNAVVTLYAQWSNSIYDVTYTPSDGINTGACTPLVAVGDKLFTATVYARDGYHLEDSMEVVIGEKTLISGYTYTRSSDWLSATLTIDASEILGSTTVTAAAAQHSYTASYAGADSQDTHTAYCTCGATVTQRCTGGTATCTAAKVCDKCLTSYGTALGHKTVDVAAVEANCLHIGNKAYSYCSVCDVILTLDGADVESEGMTLTANSADTLTAQLEHSYTGTVRINGDKTHSLQCVNGCNEYGKKLTCRDAEPVITAATCIADAFTTYTCDTCGYVWVVTQTGSALGHKYGAWYTNSNGTHSRDCTVCAAGTKGHTETVSCTYKKVVTAPTCTAQGYTTYTCRICAYTYIGDYVNAPGHNYSSWIVTEKATCTSVGSQKKVCSRCGETKLSEIPVNPKNHADVTEVPGIPATCCAEGISSGVYCNDCKTYLSGHEVLAVDVNAHNWDDGVLASPLTCTEGSIKTFTCRNNASHTYQIYVPAPGHGRSFINGKTDSGNCTWTSAVCSFHGCLDSAVILHLYFDSGNPMVSTKITIDGENFLRETATDTEGNVAFTLTPGEYLVTIARGNYDLKLTLGDDGSITCVRIDKDANCACNCHKTDFYSRLVFAIMNFFNKLFKINRVCDCGINHF